MTDAEQVKYLRRIAADQPIVKPVGRVLVRAGLVTHFRDYERREWGKVVARLGVYVLTPKGEELLARAQVPKP
jgi:DNA-binding MarR family transcriptional regulator